MDASFVARLKIAVRNRAVVETDQRQCIGALEPVVAEHARDDLLLERICDWHNRALEYYSDSVEWQPQSTAEWLMNSVVSSDSRLLFLVLNEWGTRIGLCGLSQIGSEQAEIYDIVRGEPGGHALLLPYAQVAMLRLCFFGIEVPRVVGAVHRQNAPARRMGRLVGFEEYGYRLKRLGDGEQVITDLPSIPTEKNAQVLLRITREKFVEKHPELSGLPDLRGESVPVAGK